MLDACRLYVGTEDGAFVFDVDGDGATRVGRGLAGQTVREIAVDPRDRDVAYVGCGLRGWGLHRTDDAGGSFASLGFGDRWVWGVTVDSSDPDTVYAGTEPPMLYRSRDRGGSWTAFDAIDDLPSRDRWTFFYDPFRAGHVHGIDVHPDRPDRVFAGVEHGGVLSSLDGSGTWRDGLAGFDVHQTAVVPGDPDRVLATAGEGLYASDDAGASWTAIDGFGDYYVKSVARDPTDPGRLLVNASVEGAWRDARVFESRDGGREWREFRDVPPVSVVGCDVLAVHPGGDAVFHATNGEDGRGQVVVRIAGDQGWRRVGPTLPKIRAVEAARP